MKRPKPNMAERMRGAFRESGLSIRRLAVEAGIPYASAHAFVTGDRDPALSTVEKMCGALGLELRPVPRSRRKR